MSTAYLLLFVVYPFICLAVFLMGSLARFDRDQYTWKSDSSQLLRARQHGFAGGKAHGLQAVSRGGGEGLDGFGQCLGIACGHQPAGFGADQFGHSHDGGGNHRAGGGEGFHHHQRQAFGE